MTSDPEISTFDVERLSGTNTLRVHDSFRRERVTDARPARIASGSPKWQ